MIEKYYKFTFRSELLYIGERTKKGTLKPFISPLHAKYKGKFRTEGILPIPYSTLTGAIAALLGENKNIHAIGKITSYEKSYMAVAPYDAAINTAKLPITIEYLTNVKGEMYVKKTDDFHSPTLLGDAIYLGGLKSKGFGRCEFVSDKEFEPETIKGDGVFLSRIYYEDETLAQFGMTPANIIKPYFGYLFKRTSDYDGYYQKAIFENTILRNAYNFLVEVIK